jgi:hypothetical protein
LLSLALGTVALETSHLVVCPQIPQTAIWRGRQFRQSGPSEVRLATRLRRPQPEHSSRLIGSLIRQLGHRGLPSVSTSPPRSTHRPHRSLRSAAPLKLLPEPADLDLYRIRRQARVGGLIKSAA